MNINRESKKTLNLLNKLTGGPLTLGGLIRAIRKGEEQSQVAFAKQLAISRQKLCDIEHGRCILSPKMASDFAKQLGYSENQFVRLALQDILNRDGIGLMVEVRSVA